MKKVYVSMALVLLCAIGTVAKAQGNYQQLINQYVGERTITLQWLGKETKPGKVTVSQEAGSLEVQIKGTQRKSDSEFVSIEGTIEPKSANEFIFKGKIITQVSYINNGAACEKDGQFTFKKTQGRKFWRLQEMSNCANDGTVDYVDIF
jgi:hypothetical protein